MQALGARMLVDGDLLRRRRIAPVDQHQLGARGLALDAAVEDDVAVARAGEGVELVGQLQLGDVGQVLLGVEVRLHHPLARPGEPARVHLRGRFAGHVSEQLHEAFARLSAARPAARQPRALIEHALDHPLAVGLGEEDQLRLPVFVGIEIDAGPVLFQGGKVVADLADGIEHDVAEEHLRLAVHLLVVRVVLGEAFGEPEREGPDGALQSGAGGALGHLLDVELVGHLVGGDELEHLLLAGVGQRHPQILRAGHAEHALLHLEDVGFEEFAIGIVENVRDLDRRLVLKAIAQIAPALAHQPCRDAGHMVFAVVIVESHAGRAVVVEEIEIAPVVIEVADQVLSRPPRNHVGLLPEAVGRAAGHLREAAVLGPGQRQGRARGQEPGRDAERERGRGKESADDGHLHPQHGAPVRPSGDCAARSLSFIQPVSKARRQAPHDGSALRRQPRRMVVRSCGMAARGDRKNCMGE